MLSDPGPIVIFILTPLLVMAVMRTTQETILVARGFLDANGAEQVVPGMTAMFSFFWTAFVGRTFFFEHGWGTWDRLQTSEASGSEILLGKLLPALVIIIAQLTLLFTIGALLFDLSSEGIVYLLFLVAVPLATAVIAFSLALVAICGKLPQLEAIGNMTMILFAAIGGALTPTYVLPAWAESLAPLTPTYWVMRAAEDVILQDKGLSSVLVPAGVLVLFTVAFAALAVANFRFSARKTVEA